MDFAAPGFRLLPEWLDRPAQEALMGELVALLGAEAFEVREATGAGGEAGAGESPPLPFYKPVMPRTGAPFSVAMTNLGRLGWVSDQAGGYRYETTHPVTGAPWPAIPDTLLGIWRTLLPEAPAPDCCLVNLYRGAAKMGLHRDDTEEDQETPVLSLSLGDTAKFRLGNLKRGGKTASFRLASGDVVILGGESRLRYHGIDRLQPGSSTLVPGGGRVNLTMRRVGR